MSEYRPSDESVGFVAKVRNQPPTETAGKNPTDELMGEVAEIREATKRGVVVGATVTSRDTSRFVGGGRIVSISPTSGLAVLDSGVSVNVDHLILA